MKIFGTVMKILAALAAIAGVVYVVATYGDKIIAWAKKLLGKVGCCTCCEAETVDAPAEEVSVQEVSAEEDAVQAEETDFEG